MFQSFCYIYSKGWRALFYFLIEASRHIELSAKAKNVRLQRQGFHFPSTDPTWSFVTSYHVLHWPTTYPVRRRECMPSVLRRSPRLQSRTLSFVGYWLLRGAPQPAFPYSIPDREWLNRLLNRTRPPGKKLLAKRSVVTPSPCRNHRRFYSSNSIWWRYVQSCPNIG